MHIQLTTPIRQVALQVSTYMVTLLLVQALLWSVVLALQVSHALFNYRS